MIKVQLEKFEGPLALLLHLIRKNEMNIYDIEIHKITAQYLEFIQTMKQLDLEVAGDFVAMASTLIHIKSKMLLPQYNDQGEVVESEDPRRELVQRLLEYQQYQDVAKQLGRRPLLGREMWSRPVKEMSSAGEPEIILEDGGLFAMIAGYKRVLSALKKKVHVVFAQSQSVASRVLELRSYLIPGRRFQMTELIKSAEATRSKVVITFLSMLELGKLGFVSVFQNETYGPIYIDVKKRVEGEIIQQMDDYGAKDLATTLLDSPVETIEDALPLMEASNLAAEDTAIVGATDDELAEAEAALGFEESESSEVVLDTEMSFVESSSEIAKVEALAVEGGEMAELSQTPVVVSPQLNVSDAINAARDAADSFLENEEDKTSEI